MKLMLALLLLFPLVAQAQTPTRTALIAWIPAPTCEDGDTDLTHCQVTGYRIETAASCAATTWNFLVSVGPVLSYRAVDVPPGPRCYRLKATSEAGDSRASQGAPLAEVVITQKRAGPPASVTVTATATTTVTP